MKRSKLKLNRETIGKLEGRLRQVRGAEDTCTCCSCCPTCNATCGGSCTCPPASETCFSDTCTQNNESNCICA